MKGTKSDRETLRNRVKDALGERTQKQLEQSLGVSGGTLSRVFGGRRNVDAEFLRGLANELDVDVRRLLHGTDFLLLFDDEELPPEPSEVDVVAPLPPVPSEGPAPVESLPSRGGATPENPPEPDRRSLAAVARTSPDVPNRQDPDQPEVSLADRDTEPTVPVVELSGASQVQPDEISHTSPEPDRSPTEAEPEEAPEPDDRTVTVDEPVRPAPPPPRGIGGRIRRFLSNLFGG